MSYVLTGALFVAIAVGAFVWRMIGDARTVVSGEPTQPAPAQTGIAGGDYGGMAAGADGGSAGGADGGGSGPS